ncbi:MAG TPA: DUF4270 domain-containing protein [Flavobacterium sp.]|nr:DUF4270 domain-containing protein [Flavobacterium sp.]
MKKKLLFTAVFALTGLLFVSCEKDAVELNSNVFGEDPFGFEKYEPENVDAKIISTQQVSTLNLPINTLGVFDHTVFGKTKAHFVSQIELMSGALSDIGENPELDSVYVYLPYNSKLDVTDSNGESTYTINNVYGEGSFDLAVYENGYFLRNQDPNNDFEAQQYYSDQFELFEQNKKGVGGTGRLNDATDTKQNTDFEVDDSEIKLYKTDENGEQVVAERKRPGIWLDLNKEYFQQRFFANNEYKNINNNNRLKEFFRGLLFTVENEGTGNLMMQLDLSQAEMVFVYHEDATEGRERNTLSFALGYSTASGNTRNNNTVNLFENTPTTDYTNALSDGSQQLWLKGNEGSLAEINLLSPTEIEHIKEQEWLINQAVLTVYVDAQAMQNQQDYSPSRLYLYDLTNNKALVDYTNDQTTNPYKNIYNGFFDSSEEPNKYRFRITDYIVDLISKDSTNFKLGLAVANDISNSEFKMLKNPAPETDKVPASMVSFPFGTVLYNGDDSHGANKMKLEIFYTQKQN